jgi:hypothetical protein
MMGMDDVGAGDGSEQAWRHRVGRVTAQPAQRAQRPPRKSARFTLNVRAPTEGEQLALDVPGQRPRQLERVAFAAAE